MTTTIETETITRGGTRKEDAATLIARIRDGKASGRSADLRGANLAGCDLSQLDLSAANFDDADLSRANMAGTRLFKASLENANLAGADLTGAELTGANLRGAVMESARLANAGLGSADLKGASLFRAALDEAAISKSNLKGADLRAASLKNVRLRESDLTNVDAANADLSGVDLTDSTVAGANFLHVDLRQAKLRGVRGFEKAGWIGVDVGDINFAGAYSLRRFIIDQNYLQEFRERSRWSGYVYWFWKATSDCGRSASLWCAWIAALVVGFAAAYMQLEMSWGPGQSWVTALYYSVVTVTTLGYGDILPLSKAAQVVATIQVIFGYVMLGGLLSILSNKMARRGE